MKRLLKIISLIIISIPSFSQQRAQYTQYMVNQYILNPALAGTEEFIELKAGFRKQWLGFKGGPATMYLSGHIALGRPQINKTGKAKKQRNSWHGLGTYFYNDGTGATSRLGGYVSYAYNIGITGKLRAALGAYGGIQQFKVDGNKFLLFDEEDNVLNGIHKTTVPDIILGTWIYSDKFYLGGSVHQLLRNRITFGETNLVSKDPSELVMHYFITTGYAIKMNDFTITPSIMVKQVSPAPVSVDINGKINYKNGLFWTGFSYRRLDSFSLILGTTALNGSLGISYSYDLTSSEIFKYQTGSHELVIGYRILPHPVVNCPANFW